MASLARVGAVLLLVGCAPMPVPDWHGGDEPHLAIVDLIRPPRGGGVNVVPLPTFNPPSWLYFSQLPESVAFPPDNLHYYSPPVAGTIQYQEPNGVTASIIDAYGWIWPDNTQCTGDPDWHFSFEIDPARTQIDLNTLYRIGNAIHMGRNASGADKPNQTYRVLSTTPRVHVEVTGWRKSVHGNVDPSSWGWVHSTPDCENGGVLWAFDPAKPEGKPIPAGAYVRITGLLVTDGFHICDSWGSGQLPKAPYHKDPSCDSGDLQDVKKMWAGCGMLSNCTKHEQDPNNLARWYEIHSPDAIHLEDEQRPQQEVIRQIVLSADHGFWSGMTERIEDDIWPCPNDPSKPCGDLPPGKAVAYVESIDSITNYRTITDGKCDAHGCVPKVDRYRDHIHVMAQVHGESFDGAPGKLKATYRVFTCDCACDGTCQVPGSTVRVQCAAPASCPTGSQCAGAGCVACTAAEVAQHCGNQCNRSDGCGGVCQCGAQSRCSAPYRGVCVPACTPDCAGKCNGEPDGCNGQCPTCPSGKQCTNGQCVVGCPAGTSYCAAKRACAACCPSCDGTSCGSDGCGGVCRCRGGQRCVDGSCELVCPAKTRACGDVCVAKGTECP